MLTPLLLVSHRPQIEQADCLAACAAMILDYLQIPVNYPRLQRLLNIRSFGAVFSDIVNLRTLGVSITVDEGDLSAVQGYLESGLPVIAAVNTGYLPSYWKEAVGHALVIIAVEDEGVYVNDPALLTAPRLITINEFLTAWGEKDFLYAVIGLQ